MNVVAIIQARMGSTRLPGKVLMKSLANKTLIEILYLRLQQSKNINKIILATSKNSNNTPLIKLCQSIGLKTFQGSEEDVLERYYQAALAEKADLIVRITGDCPLIDYQLVDDVIEQFKAAKYDFVSNNNPPTYPDGLDVEAFTFETLQVAHNESKKQHEREHVTPYMKESGKFKTQNLKNEYDYSDERWTVDEIDDYVLVKNVLEEINDIYASWQDIMELKSLKLDIFNVNKHIKRNEGFSIGKGQKLYKRAKKIIPGGNMLLSKRPELFLPDKWPSYFSKAKGCRVWDLDNNEYIDMSIMGIGTNILGYGNTHVDKAVNKVINNSNMSTFNCPEEVYLAERLVELHPWLDMVKFTRSGGEANAMAVRIARAASGKDKVAICGYHGWHDWYLAANLKGSSNLKSHLLPGLDPNGVPKSLEGSVFTFSYNNFEELENIVNNNEIGVIKMEVERNEQPKDNFLQKVRKLADDNNIVLIFDECTSGFRETFGGIHKKYNVEPDMCMFGKALGNGYAICAVVGKRSVMESAQSTFISSTFWTERIGPSAALATLEVMQNEESWKYITKKGEYLRKSWDKLAEKYEIKIKHLGIPALAAFEFKYEDNNLFKTFITQEMLKKGILAANSVYLCTEHTDKIINLYLENLEPIFLTIAECISSGDIKKYLDGDEAQTGFKRLN
tara:strand:+ start:2857 stop:4884 length:2028 start_codon:yes stop_codon:yes gene_type:complete